MRKVISFLFAACLMLLCACDYSPEYVDDGRLQIVCSSFPAYDFAREICGDKANITLLIKPGAEVHSFEPTPRVVVNITNCDLFICNGGESEEWVEELLDSRDSENINVLYMMDCVTAMEESDEGIYAAEEEGEEEAELDEHVWTSPVNAQLICEAISEKACAADPENAGYYSANCDEYLARLAELDKEFHAVCDNAENKTLVFADRFPMRYFTCEYGLSYYAAFPGCATETEPSAKTVAFLIDKVRDEKIPAVLYMEFSNEKMADIVCEDTGCGKLPFYSAHNISAEMFEQGVGYIDLMKINLESLKEVLN